jgi:hypothetical protein
MDRRWAAALGIAAMLGAGAYAATKGDTLFVRAKNTHLKKAPEATASTLLILQPGNPVSYVAPATGARGWHQIQAKGGEGFVYQSNLTTSKPQLEIIGAQQSVDPEVFASSGAATRALSEGAIHYGTVSESEYARAVKDIQNSETVALQVKDPDLASHEASHHLHAMVGVGAAQ